MRNYQRIRRMRIKEKKDHELKMKELNEIEESLEVDIYKHDLYHSEDDSEDLKQIIKDQDNKIQTLTRKKEFWEKEADFEVFQNRNLKEN